MKLQPEPFLPFTNVTLVRVLYRNATSYELRLYVPRRIPIEDLKTWVDLASSVYAMTTFPDLPGEIFSATLETNRAGLCFNSFVMPTEELLEVVNVVRKEKGLRPQQL